MARSWKDVRAEMVESAGLDEERISTLETELRNEERAYRLAEIRREHGLDQTALAQKLGVSQSRVSRIERGELDRAEIATIRSYVEALGGTMEIVARFGDEALTVS